MELLAATLLKMSKSLSMTQLSATTTPPGEQNLNEHDTDLRNNILTQLNQINYLLRVPTELEPDGMSAPSIKTIVPTSGFCSYAEFYGACKSIETNVIYSTNLGNIILSLGTDVDGKKFGHIQTIFCSRMYEFLLPDGNDVQKNKYYHLFFQGLDTSEIRQLLTREKILVKVENRDPLTDMIIGLTKRGSTTATLPGRFLTEEERAKLADFSATVGPKMRSLVDHVAVDIVLPDSLRLNSEKNSMSNFLNDVLGIDLESFVDSFSAPPLRILKDLNIEIRVSEAKPPKKVEPKQGVSDEKRMIAAIHDMVKKEKSYVQKLKLLEEKFVIPLKEKLSMYDYNRMVVSVADLIAGHDKILQDFTESPTVESVCKSYINNFKPLLPIYDTYTTNYSIAQQFSSQLDTEPYADVKLFIMNKEDTENSLFKNLQMEPVQRVTRIPMTLEDLKKWIGPGTLEYDFVSQALVVVHELAGSVEKSQAKIGKLEALQIFGQAICENSSDSGQFSRARLRFRCDLYAQCNMNNSKYGEHKPHSGSVVLVLFNEMIALVKRYPKSDKKFRFKRTLALDRLQVVDLGKKSFLLVEKAELYANSIIPSAKDLFFFIEVEEEEKKDVFLRLLKQVLVTSQYSAIAKNIPQPTAERYGDLDIYYTPITSPVLKSMTQSGKRRDIAFIFYENDEQYQKVLAEACMPSIDALGLIQFDPENDRVRFTLRAYGETGVEKDEEFSWLSIDEFKRQFLYSIMSAANLKNASIKYRTTAILSTLAYYLIALHSSVGNSHDPLSDASSQRPTVQSYMSKLARRFGLKEGNVSIHTYLEEGRRAGVYRPGPAGAAEEGLPLPPSGAMGPGLPQAPQGMNRLRRVGTVRDQYVPKLANIGNGIRNMAKRNKSMVPFHLSSFITVGGRIGVFGKPQILRPEVVLDRLAAFIEKEGYKDSTLYKRNADLKQVYDLFGKLTGRKKEAKYALESLKDYDVHVVAVVYREYVRSLTNLIPNQTKRLILEETRGETTDVELVPRLKAYLENTRHAKVIYRIVKHLNNISARTEDSRTSAGSIAFLFAEVLILDRVSNTNVHSMEDFNQCVANMERLIFFCDSIFPKEEEEYDKRVQQDMIESKISEFSEISFTPSQQEPCVPLYNQYQNNEDDDELKVNTQTITQPTFVAGASGAIVADNLRPNDSGLAEDKIVRLESNSQESGNSTEATPRPAKIQLSDSAMIGEETKEDSMESPTVVPEEVSLFEKPAESPQSEEPVESGLVKAQLLTRAQESLEEIERLQKEIEDLKVQQGERALVQEKPEMERETTFVQSLSSEADLLEFTVATAGKDELVLPQESNVTESFVVELQKGIASLGFDVDLGKDELALKENAELVQKNLDLKKQLNELVEYKKKLLSQSSIPIKSVNIIHDPSTATISNDLTEEV